MDVCRGGEWVCLRPALGAHGTWGCGDSRHGDSLVPLSTIRTTQVHLWVGGRLDKGQVTCPRSLGALCHAPSLHPSLLVL